jgi:hypothetical protein
MSLVFDPPVAFLAIALAVLGVLWDGGYSPASRVVFGALAVVAGLALGRWRPPVIVLLAALSALGALSALWTLGPVDRTLRWSLVTLGYAAVAALASAAARRRGGVGVLAVGVGLVAGAAGLAGLAATVTFSEPWALRIAGVWRPGGPLEYPPALALLLVSALPVFMWAMAARSRAVAGLGAVGMAVAGGVLALSASRLALAMAVVVGGLELARAGRAGAAGPGGRDPAAAPSRLDPAAAPTRLHVVAALGLGLVSGLAFQAAAGGRAIGLETDAGRIAGLAAVIGLAAPAWLAVRRLLDRRAVDGAAPPRRRSAGPAAVVAAVALAAVLAGSLAFGSQAGRGAGAQAGFLHGREHTWQAALDTFADRPIQGAGADAFLAGSARHQHGETVVFAHSLPLELAAELGIAGLALAIALYAATARLIHRARNTAAGRLLGPAAAAFLVASLVDWPWHLAGAGAIWAVAVGALAGATARNEKVARPIPLGDT